MRGPRGKRGRPGPPGITPAAIRAIIGDAEKTHAELAIQFERIAQLQAQLDRTLRALHEMGEKMGRSRKRR